MARKDGKDKGILEWPKDSGQYWMRAYHNGKEKRMGPFSTKTQAKNTYSRWQLERSRCQSLGIPFDPSTFTKAPKPKVDVYARLETVIDNFLSGCTDISINEQRRYGEWWKNIEINGRPLGRFNVQDIKANDLQRLQKLLF